MGFWAIPKPLKVTILLSPTAGVAKFATASGPGTRVTKDGTGPETAVVLNPARLAVVFPSTKILSVTPGKTSIN